MQGKFRFISTETNVTPFSKQYCLLFLENCFKSYKNCFGKACFENNENCYKKFHIYSRALKY